jgi:hypothetical protein
MNFGFEVALIKTAWGEPIEVKVSRWVLKTSSLWRHRGLSLTTVYISLVFLIMQIS